MSRILIIAEHDGSSLNLSTAKCVTCAQAIGGEIDIAVLGHGIDSVAAAAAALDSVSKVIAIDAQHLAAPLAVNWASEAVALSAEYTHLLGPSTTFGRDLMPRIAALCGVNQISDIMEVNGANSFKRPVYAGNAIVQAEPASGARVVVLSGSQVGKRRVMAQASCGKCGCQQFCCLTYALCRSDVRGRRAP